MVMFVYKIYVYTIDRTHQKKNKTKKAVVQDHKEN